MGLLDKLWDDTLGGQQPDQGLGRLRKLDIPKSPRVLQRSESAVDSPRSESYSLDSPREIFPQSLLDRRRSADFRDGQEEARRVTQSISISKPGLLERSASVNSPYSSSPGSPLASSPSVRGNDNVWRSVFHPGGHKTPVYGASKYDKAEPNSPSIHDWSVSAPDWTTYVQSP